MSLTFKGVNFGFGGSDLADEIQANIVMWLNWGLLHHGAFGRASISGTTPYATSPSQLRTIYDERYGRGHVWEGAGASWVWESGVNIANPPTRVSGILFDNTFYPLGVNGSWSYQVDYRHGRIIFDNAQSPESDLRAEYCYRLVQVENADHPAFFLLLQHSIVEQLDFAIPSGLPIKEMRAVLPAIFIDQRAGGQRGLELGGGQIKTREIVLNIFADNPKDRNTLMDWLDKQSRASFDMVDLNKAPSIYDNYGGVSPGITNWPDLVRDYPGRRLRIMDGRSAKVDCVNPNIHRGRVSWNVEIDIPGI